MIRRAEASDLPAIRAITEAAYAPWIGVIGRKPRPMAADYDRALRDHRIDLLCPESDPVALIETAAKPDHLLPGHLLIVSVAVRPECQGQGHGRTLLDHAERLAAAAGLPETRLYTNKLFARNIRLYRALGYAITHEENVETGIIVHMRKPLTRPPRG